MNLYDTLSKSIIYLLKCPIFVDLISATIVTDIFFFINKNKNMIWYEKKEMLNTNSILVINTKFTNNKKVNLN